MLSRFGIRAVTHDVLLPQLRPRLLAVPGRDGSYDFGARCYEDRRIRIACDSMRGLARGELRELAYLLSQKGKLVLWDEPDKHYAARLYDPTALSYLGRAGHAFELLFVCEPFAVGRRVKRGEAGLVHYAGTAQTPVRLTLRNVGTTTVKRLRIVIRRIHPLGT